MKCEFNYPRSRKIEKRERSRSPSRKSRDRDIKGNGTSSPARDVKNNDIGRMIPLNNEDSTKPKEDDAPSSNLQSDPKPYVFQM